MVNRLSFSQSDLMKIIEEIDQDENCGGLVPIPKVFEKVKLHISLAELHQILLQIERKNLIYFESINDPSRLSLDEKDKGINDSVRGLLFYIGKW